MTHKTNARLRNPSLVRVLLLLILTSSASAKGKEQVLYSFQGGTDGATPAGGVVFDKAGNLYGATTDGGADNCSPVANCGTVYQLAPPVQKGGAWTETILRVFEGKAFNDGELPAGGVIADTNGNIYGTTAYGGTGSCVLLGVLGGCGTVWEMSPPQTKGGAWTYTILYSFQGGNDGYLPNGDLVFDNRGNLYGATEFGGGQGTACDPDYQYCGTVFKLSPPMQKGGAWTEQVLHSFAGGSDGANPNGGLVLDKSGAIYGSAVSGGSQSCKTSYSVGCGTVFQLKPSKKKGGRWTEKQLHVFTGGNDGGGPNGVILDPKGALYGTASGGTGLGVVFRLRLGKNQHWTNAVLHNFPNCGDGCLPYAVILDSYGNLYGTGDGGGFSRGTIFQLDPPVPKGGPWRYSLLYSFKGSPDGASPLEMIFRGSGTIYGVTQSGGSGQLCQGGCGTVFRVTL